ncbi:MAG: hypothetical protein ACM3O3_12045 [Syntrophothermus sp.]
MPKNQYSTTKQKKAIPHNIRIYILLFALIFVSGICVAEFLVYKIRISTGYFKLEFSNIAELVVTLFVGIYAARHIGQTINNSSKILELRLSALQKLEGYCESIHTVFHTDLSFNEPVFKEHNIINDSFRHGLGILSVLLHEVYVDDNHKKSKLKVIYKEFTDLNYQFEDIYSNKRKLPLQEFRQLHSQIQSLINSILNCKIAIYS